MKSMMVCSLQEYHRNLPRIRTKGIRFDAAENGREA
jgi:hypothetical protein